jgi:hypothetical protein
VRTRLSVGCAAIGLVLLLEGSEADPAGPVLEPKLPAALFHPAESTRREAEELAERWAPSFAQDTDRGHPERDRPLPIDFDSDWDATNNWRHLTPEHASAEPAVYASAILTGTHAYLTYMLFYPRDWAWPGCVSYVCHDNDLELALLIVTRNRRPGDSELVVVETKAHQRYVARRGSEVLRTANGAPWIAIESQGHGMQPIAVGRVPPADAAILTPASAETPRAVRYDLLPLHSTLWKRRAPSAAGARLWIEGESGFLAYAGERQGRLGFWLGASMAGQEYSGGVRPPWALKAPAGARGDWFLDPALVAFDRHGGWLGPRSAASRDYVFNPYLADLAAECAGQRCPAGPVASSEAPALPPVAGALLLALGLLSLRSRSANA